MDWFEFSCQGQLREGVAEHLQAQKLKAQECDCPQPLEGAPFPLYVAATGAKPFAWVAKSDDLRLMFSQSASVPAASARATADGLAAYGHEGLYAMALDALDFYTRSTPTTCSRVDLAVDYQGMPFSSELMDNVVCRASYHGLHGHHGVDETFHRGSDALQVRVYNKTRELPKSGKWYLVDAWSQTPGYDPDADVWRFEAQLRREGIQSFGVKSPDEVLDALPHLLGSMLDWFSLRVPKGANRSRWPVDPRWEELRAGAFAGEPLPRVHEAKRLAQFERTVSQLKGHVISLAAVRNIKDLDRALGVAQDAVRRALVEEGDFETLVRRRIAERTG